MRKKGAPLLVVTGAAANFIPAGKRKKLWPAKKAWCPSTAKKRTRGQKRTRPTGRRAGCEGGGQEERTPLSLKEVVGDGKKFFVFFFFVKSFFFKKKVVEMGLEPMALGLLDPRSTD